MTTTADKVISKPGIKNTEFWNIPLFVGVLVANGSGYVTVSDAHIALLAAIMFGYGVGTQAKKYVLAKNGNRVVGPDGPAPMDENTPLK